MSFSVEDSGSPVWLRSTRCVADGHCVEAARIGDRVGLRNSRLPGVTLILDTAMFRDFVADARAGNLDGPTER